MNSHSGFKGLFRTIGVLLLVLCGLASGQSGVTTTSSITVEVCCSSQLKVDAPHTVTVVLQSPGGIGTTITVDIPKGTTSQAAAGLIATAIGQAFGIATPTVTANLAPRYAEGTAWTITLKDGTPPVRKVRVQKWVNQHPQNDDGHMKVRDNMGHKVSNPSPAQFAPTTINGFSALYFKEIMWIGGNKTLELYLAGHDENGIPFTYSQTLTYYPGGYQPPNPFGGLGRFFAALGMTVAYPSSSELDVTVYPSQLHIEEIEFTMWDSTRITDPANPPGPSEAHWEFTAND